MTGQAADQMEQVCKAFPGAVTETVAGSVTLVTVPGLRLPAGWNRETTTVSFLVPVGYPMARPDCFYADADLRLAAGGLPANASPQQVPGTAETRLWFSWHLATWNPLRDTLLTYVRVIQDRLARAQ